MLCSELKRQLDKPQVWFYKYFPTRIKNVWKSRSCLPPEGKFY